MELFKKTKELEGKITTFLINIIQSGLFFSQAFEHYFADEVSPVFLDLRAKVSALEAENDSLRRDVENQLYAQMLLPDMRSDILSLIEGCDKIINKYESDLILVSVERPQIPDALKPDLTHLIAVNINCVGTLVSGMKTVLGGTHVSDFVQEVYNLEHQVDLMAIDLKQKVFQELKLPLARQLQLKEFIYSIEKISDMAEDMADLLSLFVVKHAV